MKRDPLKATVLATRYIPNATQKMVQDLITAGFLKKEQRSFVHMQNPEHALRSAMCRD